MKEKVLVTRASLPPMEEYIEEIRSIWDSHWLTNMGDKHNTLEDELKKYLSVENVSLFSNGHMALELAIQAMGLKGEVITTPFTFASTTHAIVRNGLKPVFSDINPEDYTLDVNQIEKLITPRTSAILPVHVYGNVCNIEKLQEIADKYSLKVIYDAAHAFGVEYQGKGIGEYGDASMFSFHATKVFNTIEGGAITYKDTDYGLELFRLKNFGIRGPEEVDAVGANAKMNEFQAAMGLCNLRRIEEQIQKRKSLSELYKENLKNIPGIKYRKEQENVKSNYSYFPIQIDAKEYGKTRNEVFEMLQEHNIYARKYFYPLTNEFTCYQGMYEENPTPVAKKVSEEILTLPLYVELGEEVVFKICNLLRNIK